MDRDAVWAAVDAERSSLADLLDTLRDEEWAAPSLCSAWRVRDVAAHLALSHTPPWRAVAELARAGGSFNRMIRDTARRHASATPPAELAAQIRGMVGSRRHVLGTTYLDPLVDVLVHGQDIAIPLGRDRPMPLAAAMTAADRVWAMGYPFRARQRLRGRRLVATDAEWSCGDGEEVHAPVSALLLLLTGRSVRRRAEPGITPA